MKYNSSTDKKFSSDNSKQTLNYGKKFASTLKGNEIIAICGELGSGKTIFIKGIASYFKVNQKDVRSPSYTILNIYKGRINIYHFDLYRVSEEEAEELIAEYEGYGLILIEWGNKINEVFFDKLKYIININVLKNLKRNIIIKKLKKHL